MTHDRDKTDPRGYHIFACNGCGEVAGQNDDESAARETAMEVARVYGWLVKHPGYQLYCPECAVRRVTGGEALKS